MKQVQIEDCRRIGESAFINWDALKNKTILITGSTGLIGSNLVHAFSYNSQEKGLSLRLILPVRNPEAAAEKFGQTGTDILPYTSSKALYTDVQADYIIHLASPTGSRFFVEQPVQTMRTNIEGTMNLLEYARTCPSLQKFIYLSTMEVYGTPKKGHQVTEDEIGEFDPMNVRNSYPISKLACEELCKAYYSQYRIPTIVLRATQTFGPGIAGTDGRVFAQFARCVMEKQDIVLKSEGLTERPYLYTADCVTAILVAMLRAEPGEAYTIANPDTYISIRDMAQMAADVLAGGEIKMVFDLEEDLSRYGYADTLYMNLDTGKMEGLGWKAQIDLPEMYRRMIRGVREEETEYD